MTILVRSQRHDFVDGRDVALIIQHEDGSRSVSRPLIFDHIDANSAINPPTISASGPVSGTDFLQAALDHAWEIGMRPVGFLDTTNEIATIKAHLADMRALVFKDQLKPLGEP